MPQLSEKLGRENRLSLPRLEKIVVSMGVGSAITDKKHMEEADRRAGARSPARSRSAARPSKSIAAFRLREGLDDRLQGDASPGPDVRVLDRLISLALPRVRDFRGLNPNAFDGHGNYSLGLTEQLVFPELNPDKYLRVQGMNITICSQAAVGRRIARVVARLRHAVPTRGCRSVKATARLAVDEAAFNAD